MQLKTLDYFASNLIDPLFEVYTVLADKNHIENKSLLEDLDNINSTILKEFVSEHHIDGFLNTNEDVDTGRRTYYLIFYLQKEIANAKFKKLLVTNGTVEPYNSPNLLNLKIDKNYLANTNQFDLSHYRFQKNDFVYHLCPITGASNSSYWIFQAIIRSIKESKINFKIRLDPFIEINSIDYKPVMYKMYVHGKPLEWNKLLRLRNDDFGQWFNERDNNFTDYVWSPKFDEIHFTCEEYPVHNFSGLITSRYFHAIFNKETGKIKHCDGALRIYDESELDKRRKFHIRQPEVRKIAKRVKIFQFDSNDNGGEELLQNCFSQLAINFFVWNHDVQNYFNS